MLSEYERVVPEPVAQEVLRTQIEKLKASPEALSVVEAVFKRCDVVPRGGHASPRSRCEIRMTNESWPMPFRLVHRSS